MTNPKHTDTSPSGDLVERFNRFLNEWGKSRQYGDVIYGLHVGTDREVELTATSIRQAADRIKALEAENERLRSILEQWLNTAREHLDTEVAGRTFEALRKNSHD